MVQREIQFAIANLFSFGQWSPKYLGLLTAGFETKNDTVRLTCVLILSVLCQGALQEPAETCYKSIETWFDQAPILALNERMLAIKGSLDGIRLLLISALSDNNKDVRECGRDALFILSIYCPSKLTLRIIQGIVDSIKDVKLKKYIDRQGFIGHYTVDKSSSPFRYMTTLKKPIVITLC